MNSKSQPNEDAVIELLTLAYEVDNYGNKVYRNKEGLLHRIYGPAVITKNGTKRWYKNGELHREDGPAIIWYDDNDEWFYINNRELTKDQFIQWQMENGITPIK